MPKRIHKPEYFQLKMPFYFDMVCSDRRLYDIDMMFLYKYPVKVGIRPSIYAFQPQTRRLHFFMTRSFVSFLRETKIPEFPIEWQEYFKSVQIPKQRSFPYAQDDDIKRYMSSSICGSFRGYLDRLKGIEEERIRYLLAEVNIVQWEFFVIDCVIQKKLKHQPLDKIMKVYSLDFKRERE